jgi:hypothetical protein
MKGNDIYHGNRQFPEVVKFRFQFGDSLHTLSNPSTHIILYVRTLEVIGLVPSLKEEE